MNTAIRFSSSNSPSYAHDSEAALPGGGLLTVSAAMRFSIEEARALAAELLAACGALAGGGHGGPSHAQQGPPLPMRRKYQKNLRAGRGPTVGVRGVWPA